MRGGRPRWLHARAGDPAPLDCRRTSQAHRLLLRGCRGNDFRWDSLLPNHTDVQEVAMAPSPNSNPNIVLIMCDDLGYGDLGCYGNQVIRTPHIDALAASGLRFSSAYASAAWCMPSRKGLMTGNHPYRDGIDNWQQLL